MAVKPFSPGDAEKANAESIPDEILNAVNKALTKSAGKGCTIKQEDLVVEAVAAGLDHAAIYANGWLEFESLYRLNGWEVTYDKPGFNESGKAFWRFTPA